jgi:hypothetical protein
MAIGPVKLVGVIVRYVFGIMILLSLVSEIDSLDLCGNRDLVRCVWRQ